WVNGAWTPSACSTWRSAPVRGRGDVAASREPRCDGSPCTTRTVRRGIAGSPGTRWSASRCRSSGSASSCWSWPRLPGSRRDLRHLLAVAELLLGLAERGAVGCRLERLLKLAARIEVRQRLVRGGDLVVKRLQRRADRRKGGEAAADVRDALD